MISSVRRLAFILAAAATILAGMALQWAVAPGAKGVWMPSLALWGALVWFPVFSFSGRLGSAIFAGFLLDAASLPPFGAYMLLAPALALGGETLFRSIAHDDSYVKKILIVVLLAGSAVLLAPFTRVAAGFLSSAI